jgi:hypothetical protein
VIGKTHRRFWACYNGLPASVQQLAKEKYDLWKKDPYHPSLKFEERRDGICVVRVGNHYRAIGLREGEVVAWFWIGTHEAYNRFRF